MNQLNQQQINWIEQNELLFTSNIKMTKELVNGLFAIYSWVTGKNQRPTGCGRCVASAKAAVWAAYKQTES